jgi:hypothetical protein
MQCNSVAGPDSAIVEPELGQTGIGGAMASFQDRVAGAMRLRASTFEDVEHDTTATTQSAIVVVLASISSGIAFIWYGGLTGVVTNAVWALVSWALYAGLVWIIGTQVMPGRSTEADFGQLLRTMGFGQAPGLLAFIGVIPVLGWFIWLGVVVWTIAATVVGVRQALDYDETWRAAVAVVLAFVLAVLVTSAFALATGLRAVVVS